MERIPPTVEGVVTFSSSLLKEGVENGLLSIFGLIFRECCVCSLQILAFVLQSLKGYL